jgi:hypothetical protein
LEFGATYPAQAISPASGDQEMIDILQNLL